MSSVAFFFNCVPKRLHIEANVFGVVSRYFGHGGEDAFMGVQSSDSLFLAVADGVGGKARNPEMESAIFSQTLMKSASQWLRTHTNASTRFDRSDEISSSVLSSAAGVSGGLSSFSSSSSSSSITTAASAAASSSSPIPMRYATTDLPPALESVSHSSETISVDSSSALRSSLNGSAKSSVLSDDDNDESVIVGKSYGDVDLSSCLTRQALIVAADAVSDLKTGASTICIAEIDPLNGILNSSNLGDSGVAVFRDKSMVEGKEDGVEYHPIWKTSIQERGFAIPYQLNTNSADECETAQCKLMSGDIIVIGTDGLWDNLFLHQIAGVISQELNKDSKKTDDRLKLVKNGRLTNTLIYEALKVSEDKKQITPWSQAMTDKIDMVYSGGKIDDITCGIAIYI